MKYRWKWFLEKYEKNAKEKRKCKDSKKNDSEKNNNEEIYRPTKYAWWTAIRLYLYSLLLQHLIRYNRDLKIGWFIQIYWS